MKKRFTTASRGFLLAAAGTTLVLSQALAQSPSQTHEKHCGSDDMMNSMYTQYPWLQQEARAKHQLSWEEGKRNLENNRASAPPTYIIPVVFHVIHDYGTENITDAQIFDQMMILNRDFRKQNADTSDIVTPFDLLAADCEIEFRLAQLDPNGNCTNGIERIASMETYVGDNGSKLNQWPREKYLNIWVTRNTIPGAAAYAMFPGSVDGFFYMYDGIVILSDCVGSIGTSIPYRSRVLSHEVGHYLSLEHTWGSGPVATTCGDDGILDTPQTKGWTVCELVNNMICTVGQPENVQNYMDYAYCQRMFTFGQRDAMHYALNSSVADRSNLWSAANLAATGCLNVQPTCMPHADFSSNRRMVCEGGSVTLYDESWTSNATSWNWTITNGSTVLTSTLQDPVLSNLTTTGWYDVTLIAGNSVGYDTITKTDYFLVSTDAATFTTLYSESFETANVFSLGYVINDRYGNGSYFHQANWAGHTGTHSVCLNEFGNTLRGDVDEMITPSYFLDYNTGIQLQFSYSYATAATAADLNTQEFTVYTSSDCGATWTQRWTRVGQSVVTGGFDANYYVPANATYWETVTINLPVPVAQPNLRIKFEFVAPEDGSGNNLYIDDINILSTNVGVSENENTAAFSVYPNPSDGNSMINYTLIEQSTVNTELYDISGRLVRTIYSGEQAAGNYSVPVSDETHPLAAGTYFIRMAIGDKVSSQKFIVTDNE